MRKQIIYEHRLYVKKATHICFLLLIKSLKWLRNPKQVQTDVKKTKLNN